jgi:hypothetical protein
MHLALMLIFPAVLAALGLVHDLRLFPKPGNRQTRTDAIVPSRFFKVVTDPELLTVASLCLIGLLIALNLILRFPDFGAIIQQYNQF